MKRSLVITKLESVLSTRIKEIYEARLKQPLNSIGYHLFNKTLVIVIEGSVTQVEQFLNENERQQLAQKVRDEIDNLVNSQIKKTIEEIMDVSVIDFLSDTTIDSNYSAAIAIFELKTSPSPDNG